MQCAFFEQLTRSTQVWLSDFQNAGFDAQAIVCLSDRWTDVIAITLEELQTDNSASQADRWLEKCFLQWGQHELGELIANFEDGEAEHIADDEFAEFVQEFSTTKDQARVRFLRTRIQTLREQNPDYPQTIKPTCAIRRQIAQDEVVMRYEEQPDWHDRMRKLQWDQCLPTRHIPRLLRGDEPHFVVVHLFSGRRRHQDVHYWLAQWANFRGVRLTVLSMDTAVSQAYGNLQVSGCSWQKLVDLYDHGAVAGTLAGSPCETSSAARHLAPPEGEGKVRWA